MSVISVDHLTKDYGRGHGVFDISFDIPEGEVFGYLGTNGSGKTTTIRHMMGFLKPDSGTVLVEGMDPWRQAPEIMKHVSYIPGEIAFPDLAIGTDFFKVQAQYLDLKDFSYMNYLIDLLELDPSASLKRMSKGMKQKTAIVAALMGDKEILIMDEPMRTFPSQKICPFMIRSLKWLPRSQKTWICPVKILRLQLMSCQSQKSDWMLIFPNLNMFMLLDLCRDASLGMIWI